MATVAELLTKIGFSADTRPLEKIEQRLESLNHKLRLIVGVEVVKKLAEMTSEFGHSALELQNTAMAAGLTTDAMQRLQYAVTQTGGNAGELGMTMTHLARMIYTAKMGAEDSLQTFGQLGIDSGQIASFRSTEDALYAIMDALQKVQDPIRRQALMDRALGQGSRGLGRFALEGRAAARASQDAAKQLGIIVPKATLDRLAAARVSMNSLSMMFKSIGSNLAGAFAPVLVRTVEQIQKFYVANRAVIDLTFEKWLIKAAFAFGFFRGFVGRTAEALAHFVSRHDELVERVLKIGTALLAVKVAIMGIGAGINTIKAAITVFNGIKFLAPMLAALPLLLETAAAIAAIVIGTHDLNELLFGSHDFRQTWMYQMATGTGEAGAFLQNTMQKLFSLTDMTGLTNTGANDGSMPTVNGMHPNDLRLQALVKRANAGMQVVQNMSANVPPPMIAAPGVNGMPAQGNNVVVNQKVDIAAQPGVTSQAVLGAVTSHLNSETYWSVLGAMNRQMNRVLY